MTERTESSAAKSLGEQGSSQTGLAKNEAQQRVVDAPASTTSPPCSPSDSAASTVRDAARERVADMQADWFVREVQRCRAIGMPLGCCDLWPECSHVVAWLEERDAAS